MTATWTLLDPGRPVTIGVPLPTYSVVVLDPDADRAVAPGAMGEIGIAGIGLASGYLNRPELTERAFVPDFLGIPENPSGRIYRTGDLGRVNADGEIEHHGRIDTQVKIRGYRVELTEIESVLLQVPGIAQAVVDTYQPQPDVIELVAYYSSRRDTATVDAGRVYEHLRGRLPGYMVPAYLEQLPVIPVMASGKADRKSLPAPQGPRPLATEDDYVAPADAAERTLAELLATTLGVEQVSAESHFFDVLGADSLLMARFNAAIRKHAGLPAVSMKDVYLNPTVRRLAAALAEQESASGLAREAASASPASASPDRAAAPAGRSRYVLCGAMQLLAFLGSVLAGSLVLDAGATWTAAGHGVPGIYARAVLFGAAVLLGTGALPIAAKWILIGRWKPQRIRVWSLAYLRFWIVKTLIVASPLARLCMGTPLYPLYLRALGAKIGPGAAIFTHHVPVCTDLLTVGPGSVIRKDTYLSGYRARSGVIETGAVTLGANVFVGEQTVLDIDTAIGDGAQLGHSSALHAGQAVPAGQCWHGSPAAAPGAGWDYQDGAARPLRRTAPGLVQRRAAAAGGGRGRPGGGGRGDPAAVAHRCWPVCSSAMGTRRAGCSPRRADDRCGPGLRPDAGRPAHRRHRSPASQPRPETGQASTRCTASGTALQRNVSSLSNIRFFNALLGDSSAIVRLSAGLGYHWRRCSRPAPTSGWRSSTTMPTLSAVGTGSMVSDGLSIMNAEFSSSSFRVVPAAIGARNFLGNNIAYPAGGRTGDDCLLATKVMIPVAGPVREGVGLLGSPCFEIPRSVHRDHQFDHLTTGQERRRRLAAKNRHNAVTIGLHELVRYLYVVGLVLVAFDPFGIGNLPDWAATATCIVLDFAFTLVYFVLVEHAVTGFRPLQPRFCSIYEAAFWRHERFWKVPSTAYFQIFNGTPFKNVIWRLLGVRIGRRVFDDGCGIVERSAGHRGKRLHPQRRKRPARPFPGGRHLQVRPHNDWRRLHHRHRCLRPLRDHHGPRLGTRPRFLPYEGRKCSAARLVARQPRHRGPDHGAPRQASAPA